MSLNKTNTLASKFQTLNPDLTHTSKVTIATEIRRSKNSSVGGTKESCHFSDAYNWFGAKEFKK